MKKFSSVIKGNQAAIIAVTFLSLLSAGITFMIPLSLSSLLNAQFDMKTVAVLFGLVFAGMALNVLITFLRQRFIYTFKCRLNKQLYEDLFRVNYSALCKNGATYYVDKILLAVNYYADFIMGTIPDLIQVWIVIVVSAVLIGWVSLPILLLVAVTLAVQNLGYKRINKVLAAKSVTLQNVCARGFGNVTAMFEKADYVKQCADCDGLLKLVDKDMKASHKTTCEVNTYAENASYVVEALIENMQYITYILLAFMMLKGSVSASEFVLASMMINVCFSHVRSLTRINLNMKNVNASWEFVENELRSEAERPGDRQVGEISSVKLEHTDIGYEGNELIQDVCMTLHRGDIAFVEAETGTGKSTMVKNLVGFYRTKGVFINDIPIEQVQLASLRQRVSYVSQQLSIVNGSLTDNLFMGKKEDPSVEPELSRLRFFKKYMENGRLKALDISASGSNLSGGDKQKIMIARLFIEQPDVLILDEITSSMDEDSSAMVYEELIEKFSDKIILIISHNPKVRQYANRYFKLEEKRLREISM